MHRTQYDVIANGTVENDVVECGVVPPIDYSKYDPRVVALLKRSKQVLVPVKRLLPSQWANTHGTLSKESSHKEGRFKCLPYQVSILDAFADPEVEMITFMKSARVGGTKVINMTVGYHIHQKPVSQLIVQPTMSDADGYSKQEIAPLIRDTPVLNKLVSEQKTGNSSNTILNKGYPGGTLHMVGSNSPTGFRRISVEIIFFDEVDGYLLSVGGKGSGEGDQIKLALMRGAWMVDRKAYLCSTPTIADLSRIEAYFKDSDQNYFYVPCPYCNTYQTIEFERLKWPKDKPEDAYLLCENEGCTEKKIPHAKKYWMLEHGRWKPTAEFKKNKNRGYFIWAGYSVAPNSTWGHIAREFLDSKDNEEKFKTFWNITLGRTWKEKGEQPDWKLLQEREDQFVYQKWIVPFDGWLLVAGVDVHMNDLHVVIRAFGDDEKSFLNICGNPTWRHFEAGNLG